ILQQSHAVKLLSYNFNTLLTVLWGLPTCDNKLSGTEYKNYYLRIIDPVHKTRELFRLVFDILKTKTNCNCIKVQYCLKVSRSYNILHCNFRILNCLDADTVELFSYISYDGVNISNVLCTCAYHFPRSKD